MIEQRIDLWTIEDCNARCVTTNGYIKVDGTAVMGRGVARQACDRYRGLRRIQGAALRLHGNIPTILIAGRPALVSFPVKHVWSDWADLQLIARSMILLRDLTDQQGWSRVVLPRPGCNNGHRDWERDVKPIIEALDDRFLVVWQ